MLLQEVARRLGGAQNGANAWIKNRVPRGGLDGGQRRELELRDHRQSGVEPCVCLGGRSRTAACGVGPLTS